MQVEHPSADLLRRVPVWLFVFDLLYLDRYDTRQVPLRYRDIENSRLNRSALTGRGLKG